MRARLLLSTALVSAFFGCSDTTSSGVADTGVADTGVADTGAKADSTAPDTSTPADTGVTEDTSSGSDTSVSGDTTAADGAADTAVVDSGPADTSFDAGPGKKTTVWIMRLGDGTAVATDAAAALFLDPIEVTYAGSTATGAAGTAIAIPATGASAFSLPISNSIGALSRSSNGKLVTFMAYKAAAGTAAVAASAPATIKRAAVAVNATGTVTSMELGAEANAATFSLRGAVTVDGTAFWTSAEDKGITYTATAGSTTAIVAANLRWPFAFGGQLYVTTGSASGTPGRGVLSVGTGMPTAGATLALLPGTGGTSASPYGVLPLDTDSTAGVDTLYVCDDRTTSTGGGVQKWKLESGTWVLKTTHTGGSPAGCRGVTGWVDGTSVYLVAIAMETPPRAVLMVDTIAGSTAVTTSTELAKAVTNAAYRGVAIAPAP